VKEYIYIKFAGGPLAPEAKKKNLWRKRIVKTLLFFIPKGNPDFDTLIDDVAEWQLEIDSIDHLPNREIGIDIKGQVIFVMPWLDNYGYWTDNEIKLDYFKAHFKAFEIEKAEFDKNWAVFANDIQG